jgi:hypothetical protein
MPVTEVNVAALPNFPFAGRPKVARPDFCTVRDAVIIKHDPLL